MIVKIITNKENIFFLNIKRLAYILYRVTLGLDFHACRFIRGNVAHFHLSPEEADTSCTREKLQ